jgi:anti-sigma factor RsiW
MSNLSCEQFVELVTDYLEGAMPPEDARRFDEHAATCPGCDVYLDQIRETVSAIGHLTPDHLEPEARERLLEAFRDWADEPPT